MLFPGSKTSERLTSTNASVLGKNGCRFSQLKFHSMTWVKNVMFGWHFGRKFQSLGAKATGHQTTPHTHTHTHTQTLREPFASLKLKQLHETRSFTLLHILRPLCGQGYDHGRASQKGNHNKLNRHL